MNVSFDAKRAFHNNRGLGNYSRDVIRLLTTFYPQNNYYLLNPKPGNKALFPVPDHAKEILPQRFFYKTFPDLWRSKGCLSQILSLKTDIYHGLSQELPKGIHKTGVKTVVTMHDAIFMRFPELYDALYRKIFIRKNRYSSQAADKIIAISRQTKNDCIEFFQADPNKIEVVYQGCNNIFREKVNAEKAAEVVRKYALPKQFLLNVGAIEKRKNVETIIRALKIGNIEIPLVAVGNKTDYSDEMLDLARKSGLQNRVIFLHNASFKDLPALYASAEIFIYPSRFEGFGIPILEAMCIGTPVITSRGSCFEETGGDAAHYVAYDNPEEMAYEINRILANDELRKDMIAKGFRHADEFTDEKVAANLMKVYQELI